MVIETEQLVNILEASLLVAGRPMTIGQLEGLFAHQDTKPARDEIRAALKVLEQSYENRGISLVEVASGFRLQARQELAPFIANLYQEKTPRYSRALIETLVLIAYRQPITRGEIEDVRGVAVSTNIVKTLLDREWIKILGHRDVPGRPAILGTTRQFLDYFNLKRIDELPTLSEIKDLDQIDPELAKEMALLQSEGEAQDKEGVIAEEGEADVGTVDVELYMDGNDSTSNEIVESPSEQTVEPQGEQNSELPTEQQQNVQQVDVQLEVDDAESANDETLAPDAGDLSAGVDALEADEALSEELVASADAPALHAVGESDTVH